MIKVGLILVSLLSFWFHGYQFSTGDQSIYVPQVLKLVDVQLYQRDYSVNHLPESRFSLFFPLMALIIRLTHWDIQWLYFLLYLLVHLLITWILYSLSFTLTGSRFTSLIATLLLSLPKFVGGTTITTLDIAWLPRFAVLPLFLFGLQQLALGKTKLVLLASFIVGLFHPFSGLLLLLTRLGYPIILVLLAPLIILSATGYWIMPQAWYSLLADRIPYNFISLWQFGSWANLILSLGLSGVFLLVSRRDSSVKLLTSFLKVSILSALATTLVHVVLGEIIHFTPVLQLQLLRIWLIPIYLTFIASAWLIFHFWHQTFGYKLISLLLFFILLTNFGAFRPTPIEFPHRNYREWDKLQNWVKNNTPPDSLWLTPPQRIGFRIHSQRAIVTEIKDGSSGLYSYPLAQEWQNRISDTHPLGPKSTAEILALAQKYGADYLVTFRDQPHPPLVPVFQTESFIIYEL